MERITLTYAKANLSEILDRVQAGEALAITRHGKPVAHLTPTAKPRKRIDAARLRALTTTMLPQTAPATDLMRSMRDDSF
jgi:prevent-host-death family protein